MNGDSSSNKKSESFAKSFKIENILNIEALTLSTFLLMTVMVLSCSKKGSETTSTPTNLVEVSDSSDFRNFKSMTLVPNSQNSGYQNYLEERFGSSCRVVRNHRGEIIEKYDSRQFDPSLQNSDVAFYTMKHENQIESFQQEFQLQVRNINPQSLRLFRTMLSMNQLITKTEFLRLPLTQPLSCRDPYSCVDQNPPDLGVLNSVLTTSGYNYYLQHRTFEVRGCEIRTTGHVVSTISKGRMQLQSGQDIEAYQTVESDYGPVYCMGQYYGIGESKTVTIQSLDVKAIPDLNRLTNVYYHTCGGALVAKSRVVRIDDKVIDSVRFEMKQVPIK